MQKTFLENSAKKIFIFFALIIIIFSTFLIQNTFAYRNCVYSSNNVIGDILKKYGYDINNPEVYKNVCGYMQLVANFESKSQNDDKDYCWNGKKKANGHKIYIQYSPGNKPASCVGASNTAKGYFQFVDRTFRGVRRKLRKRSFPYKDRINEYSYEQQAQFAITLWERSWSIKGIAEGDKGVGRRVYCDIHHTACDGGQIGTARNNLLNNALENWGNKGTIPNLGNGEGDEKDYTIDGIPIGYELSKFDVEKAAEEQLEKICDGTRDYGLVNYSGGICDGEKSGFEALKDMVQNAINWIIKIAFLIAVLAIFWSGFLLLTANGDISQRTRALKIFRNVIIGLFFIAAAFLLVDWFFSLFNIDDSYKFTSHNG